MTLILALLLFLQPPTPTATATFTRTVTVNETLSSPPLTPDGDNHPIIQGFIDSLPDGATVKLPQGVWPVHSPIHITKALTLEPVVPGKTTLLGKFTTGHVMVIKTGVYGASVKANNVKLKGLILECAPAPAAGPVNCIFAYGDDLVVEDCTLKGAAHEGIVAAGDSFRARVTNCTARNCGLGNAFYSLPTAAFNVYARMAVVTGCKAFDSGQGYECGGTDVKVLNCHAIDCEKGFNIGSNGSGIYKTEVAYCTYVGKGTAVTAGNGIGTFASVSVHHCVFIGGESAVMGGKATNHVQHEWSGPDTGQSHFDDNVFIIMPRSHSGVLAYGTGWDASYAVYGREPWTFNRNKFYYMQPVVEVNTPPITVGGIISGPVEVKDNEYYWSDVAPTRGDFQTITAAVIPLTATGNKAFKLNRTERPFIYNLSPAEQTKTP